MFKRELVSWINIIVLIAAIAVIIWDASSPMFNQIVRAIIYLVGAIALMLLPWRGQKIITDEQRGNFQKVIDGYADNLFEANKRIEELEQELKKRGGDATS